MIVRVRKRAIARDHCRSFGGGTNPEGIDSMKSCDGGLRQKTRAFATVHNARGDARLAGSGRQRRLRGELRGDEPESWRDLATAIHDPVVGKTPRPRS